MSRWSHTYIARMTVLASDTMDTLDTKEPQRTPPTQSVNSVQSVIGAECVAGGPSPSLSDDQCGVPAIRAEPPMPPPGTPERERVDRLHRDMVAGLLAAAMGRPASWGHPTPHDPPPGCACTLCHGRRWWSRDRCGWCCSTCHPPPVRMTTVEVVT